MKPRVAVHKFSSCDGCQLAFLNLGEDLLALDWLVDISYFAEAGLIEDTDPVDIAFVEGSIATHKDRQRIRDIRANSRLLVSIGACATAGGVQALRNLADAPAWLSSVYASPEMLDSLDTSTPIREHVKVDLELWGCPVSSRQIVAAVRALLSGAMPEQERGKLCMACKRQQVVCVMVTRGEPCMGPVTRTGCGALCPSFGRDCYGCYGPSESPNTEALGRRFEGLGLVPEEVARRFLAINSQADDFLAAGKRWESDGD